MCYGCYEVLYGDQHLISIDAYCHMLTHFVVIPECFHIIAGGTPAKIPGHRKVTRPTVTVN